MAIITTSTSIGSSPINTQVTSDAAGAADSVEMLIPAANAHNFLGVQMFNSGGALVLASAGSFAVKVKTVNTMQFEDPPIATISGGAPVTLDWGANTVEVQVIPTGLTGVDTWKVIVTSNRN